MQLKLASNDSYALEERDPSLRMSAVLHVQVQFAPGKHLRSAEQGLFNCPANKELIGKAQTTVYPDFLALY